VSGSETYDVTVRGAASDLIRAEFDDVRVTVTDDYTRFSTPPVDQAWLFGLISRIENLGLVLLELKITPPTPVAQHV
jgi:hypothetical protein